MCLAFLTIFVNSAKVGSFILNTCGTSGINRFSQFSRSLSHNILLCDGFKYSSTLSIVLSKMPLFGLPKPVSCEIIWIVYESLPSLPFLGGLRVTNLPIRLTCPTSVCLSDHLSTFLFPDSNSKMLCPIKFKLDRDIDHHHS